MHIPKPLPQSAIAPADVTTKKTVAAKLVTGKGHSVRRIRQHFETKEKVIKATNTTTSQADTSSHEIKVINEPVTTRTTTTTDSSASKSGTPAQVTASRSSGPSNVKYQSVPLEPEIEVITSPSTGKNAEHIELEVFDSPSTSSNPVRAHPAKKFEKNLALAPFRSFQCNFDDFSTTGKIDTTQTNVETSADKGDSGTADTTSHEIKVINEPVTTRTTTTTDSSASKSGTPAQVTASRSSGPSTIKYQPVPLEPEIEVITSPSTGKNAEHIELEVFDSPSTSSNPVRAHPARKIAKNLALAPFRWFQCRFDDFSTTGKRDTTNVENSADKGDSGTRGKRDATPTNNESSVDKSSAPLLNNALAQYLKLEDESDKQTHKKEIIRLIQNTSGIDDQNSDGNTPLHLAVAAQDLEIVEAIKAKNPTLKQNNLKRTALHEASALRNTDILPLLLPEGRIHNQPSAPGQTDFIDQPDSAGLSPLSISLIHANPDMTQALIKLGANPALKDKFGQTALHQAVTFGAENCIDTLLQSTPRLIDDIDTERCTALHRACFFGRTAIVEKITKCPLFDWGKHLDLQDGYGRTPIACAVYGQNVNCMERLIAKGADINIQNYKGLSLIAQACLSAGESRKSDDQTVNTIVNRLMALGAKPTTRMEGGLSCLHLSAQTENVELLKLLLDAGLDPTLQDNEGIPPLHYAAYHGSAGIAQLLLSTDGVNANTTTLEGSLPLHYACYLQQSDNLTQESINAIIRLLLRKTADPNILDSFGQTPLMTACSLGRKENIRELLRDRRVNPNSPVKNRLSPLFYVVNRIREDHGNPDDHLAMMTLLLKSNADANARSPNGTTLLNHCISTREPAVVNTLLRVAGDRINVNLENRSDGRRPLVSACFRLAYPYGTVKQLLARKADPKLGNVLIENNQTSNDCTPLHALLSPKAAVKTTEERWQVAKLLMDHKASPYQPSSKYKGCTPLNLAVNDLQNEKLAIQMIEHTPPRKQDLMLRQAHGLTVAQMAGQQKFSRLQKLLTEKMT